MNEIVEMSVFSDFQRMWIQRFPDNSLSSEWEHDVRASLLRHKQKVIDLQKELEQETLYVEYLERLLDDVEQIRKAGGDPTALINTTVTSKSFDDDKNDDIANQISTVDIVTSTTATKEQHSDGDDDEVCILIFHFSYIKIHM